MAGNNPFQKIPTEILQEIASYLPDKDIARFTSVCTSFAHQILPAESCVWKRCFENLYDLDPSRTPSEIKNEYRTRALALPYPISFKLGETKRETLWLKIVITMLLETYISSTRGPSKNLARISEAMEKSEFLYRPESGYMTRNSAPPSEGFCALQLCLTFLALNIKKKFYSLRIDYDIKGVYSFKEDLRLPLVSISNPDLRRILCIRNFWQRHLVNDSEDTFYQAYSALGEEQRPKAWDRPLGEIPEWRTSWLGFQSCIHPFPKTLQDLEAFETCADITGHLHGEPPVSLLLFQDPDENNWPPIFNAIIPLEGEDKSRRTYFRGIQKYLPGSTWESETYLIRGVIEPFTRPLGEIPGWQRICFVVYEADRDSLHILQSDSLTPIASPKGCTDDETKLVNRASKEQQDLARAIFPNERWPPIIIDEDFIWIYGYEGVILPGGRIIIGRSMDLRDLDSDKCDRGPFIFWDV